MSKFTYDERISAEAGGWLARLHSDTLSFRDEVAFQNWLASDPANAAAFEDATGVWDRLGAIPRDAFVSEKKNPWVNRRAFLAGAGTLAFAGATASLVLGSAKADTYQTAVGEQKHVRLADGTELLLDTNSCVTTRFDSDVRLLDLRYGRINCRVVQDPRQFAVKAAERLVVGNRSAFDLSYFDKYFSVFLIKGTAIVSSVDRSIQVSEGERVSILPSQPLRIDKPDPSSLTAWQKGRLVFKEETLGEAAKEMNRYSTIKLEIDDPELASKRISGGYRTGDNDGFAETLAHLLSIEVLRRNGVIKLIDSYPT